MTYREMLELAAKAAGYAIESYTPEGGAWVYLQDAPKNEDGEPPIFKWNPRHVDGDSFRLAVKLPIRAVIDEVWVTDRTSISEWEHDPFAATRSAIFRAAVKIGRNTK